MAFLVPPLGVFLIAGCGADLLINIILTILGYFSFVEQTKQHGRANMSKIFPRSHTCLLPDLGVLRSTRTRPCREDDCEQSTRRIQRERSARRDNSGHDLNTATERGAWRVARGVYCRERVFKVDNNEIPSILVAHEENWFLIAKPSDDE